MLTNISKVLRDPLSASIWGITMLIAVILWYRYSQIDYVAANYESHTFAYIDTALSW